MLNGSPEGLEKLQELFDSGELAEVLDDRPVESAHSLESNTTEARKARLIQVLRLYAESNNLALARDRTRELARELELELDRTRELELELELDQTRKLARDIVLERNLVLAGVRFLALGRDLDRELDRTRVRELDRTRVQRDITLRRSPAKKLPIMQGVLGYPTSAAADGAAIVLRWPPFPFWSAQSPLDRFWC